MNPHKIKFQSRLNKIEKNNQKYFENLLSYFLNQKKLNFQVQVTIECMSKTITKLNSYHVTNKTFALIKKVPTYNL